jgi:geranylgeranyl reductase family protein
VIDALIVGAGPAGSTAARLLAASGYDVLVVDKDAFPRDKVCGDGLIPDALNGLERAGLYEQVAERGHLSNTLSIYSASGIRIDIPGVYLTLRRKELDYILLQAATTAGAVFRVARVSAIRENREAVSAVLAGSNIEIHARTAVLATGADVSLTEQLGMVSQRPRPSAMALRCYVRSPVAVDQLVISFDRTIAPGYAWIFPLGNREYNVGCGFFYRGRPAAKPNLRRSFETFTSRFPTATEIWEAREGASRLAGAPLRCGLDTDFAFSGSRTLAIGETIGATYPFTGEGVGKAIETGEIAATQIAAALATGSIAPLAKFPELLRERLGPRYAGYRVAEDWLAKSWLGDFVAQRVRQSPELQRTLADIVNETASPQHIFSWRRLLPELMPWRSSR